MIYREAVSYIKNIERAGSDYGIERMRMLLNMLGAPDSRLKFVHVAGTNGKGSVCAYLTSVLKEAGYRVGTYNSPSVFRYNERWTINGNPLDDDGVAKYMTAVRASIDAENENRKARKDCDNNKLSPLLCGEFLPTAFEIETAVAMLAFADKGCDICVLETGLGGRWDATNAVLKKELAVITPIGLDHCALLGNTLREIAEEKAAIIKADCVTCEQCEEVMSAIRNPYEIVSGEKKYYKANVSVCKNPRLISGDINGQKFAYGDEIYEIGMLGAHQLQNAAIAVCAIEKLREIGWTISKKALRGGLKKAEWHARLEIVKNAEQRFNICIPQGKTLVFDGAHNPHGAAALANAIKNYFAKERVQLVLGILADKDVDGVLSILAPVADRITAVTPDSPRALECDKLKRKVEAYKQCDTCGNIRTAVENALNGDCDVTVLCGSLTLFGDLIQ